MTTLKVIQIGNSLGVILPKEILAHLKVVKGDSLFATEAAGAVALTPYDAEIERQLELGREIMRENRDVLRALAK